jgi:hypothetical protein
MNISEEAFLMPHVKRETAAAWKARQSPAVKEPYIGQPDGWTKPALPGTSGQMDKRTRPAGGQTAKKRRKKAISWTAGQSQTVKEP